MAAEEVLRQHGLLKWSVEPKLFGTSDQHRVWLKCAWLHMPLFVRPFLYWAYRYFVKGAFLDGRHGLVFTINQALWFRIVCDMKVQEFREAIDAAFGSQSALEDHYDFDFAHLFGGPGCYNGEDLEALRDSRAER